MRPAFDSHSRVRAEWLRSRLHDSWFAVGVFLIGIAAAMVIGWLATDLFAYRSVNDDEGVYLMQAAMLLEGQVFLRPGALTEVVRPWFFVVDQRAGETVLYGKYTPVVPAMFALARALTGAYYPALAAVAAGNVALVAVLGRAAFDRRVGLLAGALVLASPLFLFTSSVFLAYAPTTLLNLVFAVAYVRAARTRRLRWAILAGCAIGLAFFSRSYTAVLFAAPFVLHALIVLVRARETPRFRPALARLGTIAVLGAGFVGAALGYNAFVTGDPLTFPYAAFAPRDGLGFGEHELLGYELDYTPALAARTTARVVRLLVTEWVGFGLLGTVLAGLGVVVAIARWRRVARSTVGSPPDRATRDGLTRTAVAALLSGVAVSVVIGNVYFWGTYNGLENGLIHLLGPYYHFDVLAPFAVFAAAGTVAALDRVHDRACSRWNRRTARIALATVLVFAAPVAVAAETPVVAEPYDENEAQTEVLAATYAPVERTDFEDALVFVPDPYGDWQAHPFQHLRNDPGFDGDAVYALDEGPERDVATLAAVGNRTPYRFTYRGTWTGATQPVEPRLVELRRLDGRRVSATTTVGVPRGTTSARIRIETAAGYARYAVPGQERTVRVNWTVTPDSARVTNFERAREDANGSGVALPAGASEVDLAVTFTGSAGSSVTYRQELTVDRTEERIRALWPPETRICRLQTTCGREGTWVGPAGEYLGGVSVRTNATAEPSPSG